MSWIRLAVFSVVLTAGIGGALAAVALDAEELSYAVLTFAGGILVPLPRQGS